MITNHTPNVDTPKIKHNVYLFFLKNYEILLQNLKTSNEYQILYN